MSLELQIILLPPVIKEVLGTRTTDQHSTDPACIRLLAITSGITVVEAEFKCQELSDSDESLSIDDLSYKIVPARKDEAIRQYAVLCCKQAGSRGFLLSLDREFSLMVELYAPRVHSPFPKLLPSLFSDLTLLSVQALLSHL